MFTVCTLIMSAFMALIQVQKPCAPLWHLSGHFNLYKCSLYDSLPLLGKGGALYSIQLYNYETKHYNVTNMILYSDYSHKYNFNKKTLPYSPPPFWSKYQGAYFCTTLQQKCILYTIPISFLHYRHWISACVQVLCPRQ